MTQTPKDVPGDVLAQLGSRVQHQLRAHTPNDAKALRATVSTYPISGYDLGELLVTLGTGEAIVTVMDPDGAPTPVAWTRIWAPESSMAPSDSGVLQNIVSQSPLMARYGQPIDRDSAREMLARKLEEGARHAEEQDRRERDDEHYRQRMQESASSRPSTTRRSPRPEPGFVESITSSSAFKQFSRTAAREIARGLFGAGRRR